MISCSRLRIAVILFSLLTSAVPFPVLHAAQPNPLHTATRQELDIVKVLIAQENAWNAGDLDGFAKAYKDAPDTLFITRAISRGYSSLLDAYKHDYPTRAAMGTLAFSELEVRSLDENYAVVLGKYKLSRSKKEGGDADGVFTLVMEKTPKGWKIIVDHTT